MCSNVLSSFLLYIIFGCVQNTIAKTHTHTHTQPPNPANKKKAIRRKFDYIKTENRVN